MIDLEFFKLDDHSNVNTKIFHTKNLSPLEEVEFRCNLERRLILVLLHDYKRIKQTEVC